MTGETLGAYNIADLRELARARPHGPEEHLRARAVHDGERAHARRVRGGDTPRDRASPVVTDDVRGRTATQRVLQRDDVVGLALEKIYEALKFKQAGKTGYNSPTNYNAETLRGLFANLSEQADQWKP